MFALLPMSISMVIHVFGCIALSQHVVLFDVHTAPHKASKQIYEPDDVDIDCSD